MGIPETDMARYGRILILMRQYYRVAYNASQQIIEERHQKRG